MGKIKINPMTKRILQIKFIPVTLFFLIITTPVSANEIIRLNQFNNYLRQAKDLNASEKPQEAQEVLFQARKKITPTLFVRALKNSEIKQTQEEIEKMKQLVNEKIKGVVTELSTAIPSQSITPTTPVKSTIALTPAPQPTIISSITVLSEPENEKICRQVNDLLLEIKQGCDVKPFPGVDECIEEMESTKEYLGEEDYKKYHMEEKVNNLKELKSRYLGLKKQCEE